MNVNTINQINGLLPQMHQFVVNILFLQLSRGGAGFNYFIKPNGIEVEWKWKNFGRVNQKYFKLVLKYLSS